MKSDDVKKFISDVEEIIEKQPNAGLVFLAPYVDTANEKAGCPTVVDNASTLEISIAIKSLHRILIQHGGVALVPQIVDSFKDDLHNFASTESKH